MNKDIIEKEFNEATSELREVRKVLNRAISIENIKVVIPNTFEEKTLKDWDKWAKDNLYYGNYQLVAVSTMNIIYNINEKINLTYKEIENKTYIKVFYIIEKYKNEVLKLIEDSEKQEEIASIKQDLLFNKFSSLANQFVKEITENPTIAKERLLLMQENMKASLEIEIPQFRKEKQEEPKEKIEDIPAKINVEDDEEKEDIIEQKKEEM